MPSSTASASSPGQSAANLEVVLRSPNGEVLMTVNLSSLPCGEPLQRAFADRFEALAEVDGTFGSKQTFKTALYFARRLCRMTHLERPSDITSKVWREYWLSLGPSLKQGVSGLKTVLLSMPGIPEQTRITIHNSRVVKDKRTAASLTDAEAALVRSEAFACVETAVARIQAGWALVDEFAAGRLQPVDADYELARVLHDIATTGDITDFYTTKKQGGGVRQVRRLPPDVRRRLHGSESNRTSVHIAFEQLFLTAQEGAAAALCLAMSAGWNLSVALSVQAQDIERVDAMDGIDPVRMRVRMHKPRRGSQSAWTLTYRDNGPQSTCRLLGLLLDGTWRARQMFRERDLQFDNLLIVLIRGLNGARHNNELPLVTMTQIDYRTALAYQDDWRKSRDLPFATPRRLRQYFTTRQHPQGHSESMNAAYNLADGEVRRATPPTITAGLEQAYASSIDATIAQTDDALEELSFHLGANLIKEIVGGTRDTPTASCTDHEHSPLSAGHACDVGFLNCFGCSNAIVLLRHLPRITHLHDRLLQLRAAYDSPSWEQRFLPHVARIQALLTPGRYFSDASIEHARQSVTPEDHEIVAALLDRRWDVG